MTDMTNAFEDGLLDLVFTNVDLTNIGDAGGLRGSVGAGSLYITLHHSDPGETAGDGGAMASELDTSEYGQYTRQAVARSVAGWTVSGTTPTQVTNDAAITWTVMSTGTGQTATHVGIGKASTIDTQDLIIYGALDSSLAIANGITPEFAASALVIEMA